MKCHQSIKLITKYRFLFENCISEMELEVIYFEFKSANQK